ncbi:MAG: hypothetical protein M3Y41_08655 [Pseudomonadota bacterium]|nr:hypothetical protein [Pseudomonadota bacterium]
MACRGDTLSWDAFDDLGTMAEIISELRGAGAFRLLRRYRKAVARYRRGSLPRRAYR